MEQKDEPLLLERLASGDRPSALALGIYGATALRSQRVAVFAVDVLGHVHLLPPDAVEVRHWPKVAEATLDALTEDEAIEVLTAQGEEDNTIMTYLWGRKNRLTGGQNGS